MTEMVQVGRYADRVEAVIARGLLTAHGIDALIPEIYTLEADPGLVYALGGCRILVPAAQEAAARAVLAGAHDEAGLTSEDGGA
jgi:hypothetical protein